MGRVELVIIPETDEGQRVLIADLLKGASPPRVDLYGMSDGAIRSSFRSLARARDLKVFERLCNPTYLLQDTLWRFVFDGAGVFPKPEELKRFEQILFTLA